MNVIEEKGKNTLQVLCPSCNTVVVWNETSEYRPFCSQRCHDNDFLCWAEEKHVLAGNSAYNDLMSEDYIDDL